jgi:hypothetical protein
LAVTTLTCGAPSITELAAPNYPIIGDSDSNTEAKEIFGEWEEPKPYLRIVAQPA